MTRKQRKKRTFSDTAQFRLTRFSSSFVVILKIAFDFLILFLPMQQTRKTTGQVVGSGSQSAIVLNLLWVFVMFAFDFFLLLLVFVCQFVLNGLSTIISTPLNENNLNVWCKSAISQWYVAFWWMQACRSKFTNRIWFEPWELFHRQWKHFAVFFH